MSKQAYLTPRQVSEMTGISLDTLARWRCRKQRVPYLKIGRAVRYERTEVLAYLEQCRVPVSGSGGITQVREQKLSQRGDICFQSAR